MSIKLRSKKTKAGYSLYLDVYYKGKREYVFLDLFTSKNYTSSESKKRIDNQSDREILKLANETLLQYQLDFVRNGYKLIIPEKKLSLWEYLDKKALEKAHRTYVAAIKWLKQYKPMLDWYTLTPGLLNDFQKWLATHVKSATSVHHYMNRLLIIFRMAVSDGIIKPNQIEVNVVPIEETNINEKALTLNELQKLMIAESKIPVGVKQAFIFTILTGLRISDIIALKWEHVKNQTIEIKMVKTQKTLIQPISEQSQLILDSLPKMSEYVFQIGNNLETINRQLKAWARDAGIEKKLTSHVGRHTFATLGYQSGVDIYTISKLLGHTTVKHTEIYTSVNIDEKKKALKKMPKII